MNEQQVVPTGNVAATIWTEGKTDWKHLKKASEKLGVNLKLSFHETEEGGIGGDALLRKCKTFAETPQITPMIFIFDCDDESVVRQASGGATIAYKDWGNNVFSLVIPIPSHRKGFENVCIELYYSDSEIRTEDSHGRRLFLTSEFNELSGNLRNDPTVHIGNLNRLKGVTTTSKAKIVDSEVFKNNVNMALSKSDFADYIYDDIEPFSLFDFAEFGKIIDIISQIIEVARPKRYISLPDLQSLFNDLAAKGSLFEQVACAFESMLDLLEMTLQLFIVSTIRSYEDVIVNEPSKFLKKVKPIKEIISGKFTTPSIATIHQLARHCFHLIDEEGPDELQEMKECLVQRFILGAVGEVLDDLEKIFPPDSTKPRLINKAQVRRSLLEYVIPELSKYRDKLVLLPDDMGADDTDVGLNIQIWQEALEVLVNAVRPMLLQKFVLESLDQVDTIQRIYKVSVKTYVNGSMSVQQKAISFDELEEYDSNTSSLSMTRQGSQLSIHLFPFLVIKDDLLFYYKRTRASGYEYYSVADNRVFVVPTKRKFSRSVFRVDARGTQQSLFWADVTVNEKNGIKANIPKEIEEDKFVGRRRQIATIKREIIEIPNQNGIVYGVGGVGKTALMIQVSHKLLEEENCDEILFDNIIWVSAKRDLYYPFYDIVEPRKRRFESLDNVITTMLAFFKFEDIEGYSFEDKQGLLLELLKENRVLLVLDNFETIPRSEQKAIIRFFDVEVKQSLRKQPANFKVIITSREQIPCGFHQMPLTGLDQRESKQLMGRLYRPYRRAQEDLTIDQKNRLYEVSAGIPIIIKHCLGQIYEYNKSFDSVVNGLASAEAGRVVEFSFEEVLKLLRGNKCQLEIILLLELINCPLMPRQIAEILERSESEVQTAVPSLASFQCIKRSSRGRDEKYAINDEILLLTRRLIQENAELTHSIRQKITTNFTIDKQMDFTTEEVGTLGIFNDYLLEGQYLEAENFIVDQLGKKPESVLLQYHYAKYLKEQRRETGKAIELLERILEPSNNHPSVLRLLISCYTSLDIPNYTRASIFVKQIESIPFDDEGLTMEVAEFYARWSISVKMNRDINPDPIDERLRQQRYKEFADKALLWLGKVKDKTHEVYYLLAQSYFNKWDYDAAARMIEKAISLCGEDSFYTSSYKYFQNLIRSQKEKYSGRRPIYE